MLSNLVLWWLLYISQPNMAKGEDKLSKCGIVTILNGDRASTSYNYMCCEARSLLITCTPPCIDEESQLRFLNTVFCGSCMAELAGCGSLGVMTFHPLTLSMLRPSNLITLFLIAAHLYFCHRFSIHFAEHAHHLTSPINY